MCVSVWVTGVPGSLIRSVISGSQLVTLPATSVICKATSADWLWSTFLAVTRTGLLVPTVKLGSGVVALVESVTTMLLSPLPMSWTVIWPARTSDRWQDKVGIGHRTPDTGHSDSGTGHRRECHEAGTIGEPRRSASSRGGREAGLAYARRTGESHEPRVRE